MLDRLVSLLESQPGVPPELDAELAALVADAPPQVGALVRALARPHARIQLGWRSIERRYLGSLRDTWQQVVDDLDASDEHEADLARSVQIGASAGGEVYFGLCWTSRGVHVAEIDFEEGTLAWFETLDAFFEDIARIERDRGDALTPALRHVLGAPEEPAPPPPPAGPAAVWTGAPPPSPLARAQAHFAGAQSVLEVGPTPGGRRVLVRRFLAGNPYTPSAIVVLEPDGTTRALAWKETADVYGLCVVPGHERVLVCTGTPGPIVELDLVSGESVERHAKARWSVGFVDDRHYVVHEDKEIGVYAYPSPERLSSIPTSTFNLFVAHGRVLTLPPGELEVHVLRDGALVSVARGPLAQRVNLLNAAVVHEGRLLVGSIVSWLPTPIWLDLGPAD